jgi:hypothetical protein
MRSFLRLLAVMGGLLLAVASVSHIADAAVLRVTQQLAEQLHAAEVPNPSPVYAMPALCRNTSYTCGASATDCAWTVPPGTRLRIGGGLTASLSYRTSYTLPDAGTVSAASISDKSLGVGSYEFGYTPLADVMPDGGVPVILHLSAADPSAGFWTCQ